MSDALPRPEMSHLLFTNVREEYKKSHTKLPPVLWHHTNLAAFEGILSSNSLWATHVRFMADPTELLYGMKILRNAFDKVLETSCNDFQTLPQVWQEELANTTIEFLTANTLDYQTFIASFTSTKHSLHQWMTYGASGQGVAIGFDSQNLNYLFARQNGGENWTIGSVRAVEYRYEEQILKLSKVILGYLSEAAKYGADGYELPELRIAAFASMSTTLSDLLPLFKSSDFIVEDEFRCVMTVQLSKLIKSDGRCMKFRKGERTHIPYVELFCRTLEPPQELPLPIREVLLGNTGEMIDNRVLSANLILSAYGRDIKATSTEIIPVQRP